MMAVMTERPLRTLTTVALLIACAAIDRPLDGAQGALAQSVPSAASQLPAPGANVTLAAEACTAARLEKSAEPPGGNDTTSRIGLAG